MMSKQKMSALIAVALIAMTYVVASPYITVYEIKTAAEQHDGEALSEHIDFPSVRQSLKDQMNAVFMKQMTSTDMQGNPFGALGLAFAGTLVDKMVDALVTPAGLTEIMKGQKPAPAQEANASGDQSGSDPSPAGGDVPNTSNSKPFEGAKMSYQSLDKFMVSIDDKSGGKTRFILRRHGLEWKLSEILIPTDQ